MEKGRFFVNQGEMRGFLSFFRGRLEWFVCPYPVASAGNACELLSLTVIEERLESRHLQLYRPQRGNPMNIFRLTTTTLSLTLLVLVAACGGGGGSSNSPNTLSASDVWNVLRDRAARCIFPFYVGCFLNYKIVTMCSRFSGSSQQFYQRRYVYHVNN